MRNQIYLFIFILLGLYSCSEDNNQNSESFSKTSSESIAFRVNASDKLKSFETTEVLSQLFFEFGIKKIFVENLNDGKKKISFVSANSNFINDNFSNFIDNEFIIEENLIYEDKSPLNILKLENNNLFYKEGENNSFIDINLITNNDNISLLKLLLLMNEIQTPNDDKKTYENYLEIYNGRGGCHFSDQVIAFGFGFSQAGAMADLEWTLNNSVNNFYCKRISPRAEISDWGGFYTATVTFCCRNGGNGGSW